MSENETVVDVCEEMRGHAKDGEFVSGYEVERLADRIKAAYERDKNSIIASMMLKDKECGELRELLKPILECDVSYFDKIHWWNAFYAVRDVQWKARKRDDIQSKA